MNRARLFFMPAGWSLRPGARVRGDGILDAVATGPRRRWPDLGLPRRRELLLAALLLFAYGFFQQQPAWNENSRYDLVRALVEEGTTQIDTPASRRIPATRPCTRGTGTRTSHPAAHCSASPSTSF